MGRSPQPQNPRARIALVVPEFPKPSETFIVRQAVGLYERGWDVHVVARKVHADGFSQHMALERHPDFRRRVHRLPDTSPRWRAALGMLSQAPKLLLRHRQRADPPMAPSLRRLAGLYADGPLLDLQPDLVHFEFGSLAVGRLPARRSTSSSPRTVVSFRGYDINFVGLEADAGSEPYYSDVWRRADGLHFLGHDLRRRALERGCPPDKLHALIAPAVDCEGFQPPRTPHAETRSGPLRITSVGRMVWKKGYDYALRAVRATLDAGIDCRYTMIGDGPQIGPLRFMRHQLGLSDHVEILGVVPPRDVEAHLRETDIFLHLAVSEGFCNAVLEAQAMAVPTVVSDADGLSENVAHGESGFVVPRYDSDAAASRLVQLARDPELRRRMGIEGRRRAAEIFTPERELEGFERLYNEVLAA